MKYSNEELTELLMKLEKESLVEALTELWTAPESHGVINRLVSSPEERRESVVGNVLWFSKQVKSDHIPEYDRLAFFLKQIIQNIRRDIGDPVEAVQLLERIFATDETVMSSLSYYDEYIESIYTDAAGELFAELAVKCGDMVLVSDVIVRLIREKTFPAYDTCCARAVLTDYAEDFMKPAGYDELIKRIRSFDPEYGERNSISLENTVIKRDHDFNMDRAHDLECEEGVFPFDD